MIETAIVEDIISKDNDGKVVLKKIRPEACHNCSSKVLCGVKNEFCFRAVNRTEQPLKIGDVVEFSLPEISVSKLAFMVYGIPLIIFLFILFIMVGIFHVNEYVAVGRSLAALFGTYILTAIYDKKVFGNSEAALPKIVKKI
jgi:sigma-E factor negative regulatory protein RseC